MAYVSVYDLTTGIFSGLQLDVPASVLSSYLPPNAGVMPGRHHHLKVRVDVGTSEVVPYTPPKPDDTDLAVFVWDAPAHAWVPEPTDLAVANDVRTKRARLLAESDWVAIRAADVGPQPGDEAWATYRAALRDIPEQQGFPRTVTWPEAPSAA